MRLSRPCLLLTLFLLCASTTRLSSQSNASPAITFKGASNYSQAELLTFTGLKPGSATQQQMNDAAQRLNDTGLFDEVNFAGNDRKIVFTLKPARATLLARFSNFIWWQDDELNRNIKARIPLYRASAVPVGGNMEDAICAALKAMLEEKGIVGATISLMPQGKHLVFSIDSPSVRIRSLTLNGASPAMQPKIAHVLHEMAGQPWDKDETFKDISVRVGDDYRNDGYREFALVNEAHSAPTITANGIELELTAAINEGPQYHVSHFDWAGSEVLSPADLKKIATLKVGDLDSAYFLQESLQLIAKAYQTKGFMLAMASAPPVVDPATHQVSYTLSVVAGPLYLFNSVRFVGVSDELGKQLSAAWQMKPGDVYDGTYARKFITQNPALLKQGYRPIPQPKIDSVVHTVDITMSYLKAAPAK